MDKKDHYIALLEEKVAILSKNNELLSEQNRMLSRRVEALEKRQAEREKKNSSNSSIPPSKDEKGPKKNSTTRKPSGRKAGGQEGHRGHTLEMVSRPDGTKELFPSACSSCGRGLDTSHARLSEKRQVFDLPPIGMEVTEYRSYSVECSCGHCERAAFPGNVKAPVQYGPRVLALGNLISTVHCVSDKRVCDLLYAISGYRINESTLQNSRRKLYEGLEGTEDRVKTALYESSVLHADETGFRVNGRVQYVHVVSNRDYTCYHLGPGRNTEAVINMDILPEYGGTLSTDCFKIYEWLSCRKAKCNAHLLRDLQWVMDTEGSPPWAKGFYGLLISTKAKVDACKAKGKDRLPPGRLSTISRKWDGYWQQGMECCKPPPGGGKGAKSDGERLLNRLKLLKGEYLLFAHDFGVPFDNNQAERDLRMLKTKQKVSGNMRTSTGAARFLRIKGYLSTLQKQGEDLIENLAMVFSGNHWTPQSI